VDEPLLYEPTDSPFGLKVRMCLQLKGIAFRRVTVTVGRRRELGRLGPRGRVPLLVYGTEVVGDSSLIARFIDDRHPDPRLFPQDAAARAYCLLVEQWADAALHPLVGACKWLNPENRDAALANTADEVAGGWLRPLVGWYLVRAARRRCRALGRRQEDVPLLRARLREHLAVLASLLDGRPYLLGRSVTLADLSAFAQLAWMQRYAEARLLDDVPAVVTWLDRVAEIPAVSAALAA
jgi:glutathione S-transferase